MNITHVVENLGRGGLERMVLELIKIQQKQGHRCRVVCVFERGPLAGELDERGIPVDACNKRQGLDLHALAKIRRLVRQHATEVLHTHNAVAHYQAVLACLGLGLQQVINTRHGMGGNQRSARREWLYRRAMSQTNAVVTVCEAARHDAIRRGIVPAGLAQVVPNGIPLGGFAPASPQRRHALRVTLGLTPATRLIGTVGRLNWAKDQRGLIRAFVTVWQHERDTALVLIGDGELRDELERFAIEEGIRDHVHFLGDRSDVRELLQGLDLFVLSSVSEGYSMALLEACAAALPIVATDVGGNGEIVRDGETGCLVAPGDPLSLSRALLTLLQRPQLARTLGNAAREWVEQHGALETMVARYARLYRQGADESCV